MLTSQILSLSWYSLVQLYHLPLKCHLSKLSRNENPVPKQWISRIFRVTGANQNARKLLSTDLVNTKTLICSVSCLWVAEFLKLPYFLVLIPPPKSVRLLATNKRELTVHWQRPPELKGIPKIDYRLLLKPQDHQSTSCIQVQYVNNWHWYNEEQLVAKFRNNWTHSNVFWFVVIFQKLKG